MAITASDKLASANITPGTSFSFSPAVGISAADSWAVLAVCAENADTNGEAHSTFTVTDSEGNTWTRRVAPLYDPGAAGDGIEGAIFTTPQDGGQITTSTTITVTFDVSVTVKAHSFIEVAPSSGYVLEYVTGGVSAGSNTNSPTVTTGSISSGNIVIGALFSENSGGFTGDSDTTNGSWSSAQTAQPNGAGVCTQWKVVNASGTQTYNPTTSNTTDSIIGWIEITETNQQTVSPSSLEQTVSFGSPTFAAVVAAAGLASAVSFGTPTLARTVAPASLTSTVSFGQPAISGDISISVSSLEQTVSLGTATAGVSVTVSPGGLTSTTAFGSPTVAQSATVSPSGLSSTVSFGSPTIEVPIDSGYSNHRPTMAEYRRMAYLSNGWDKCKRWDGRTTNIETAGIAGPSADLDSWTPSPTEAAGDCEVGVHVVRYRYLDSKTGYVSNPSEEREVEVTSTNGELTFAIDTSGAGNIIRSTDSKVDRIVVEMTVLGGSEFFKAAEALNSASTIVVDISDAELETQFLPWDNDGHDPPPVAKYIVSHRDRLWLFGQVVHSTGTADFTNSSTDVDEGATDPDWRASALGDSTASPATYPSVAWFIQKDGDSAVYEIDTYDASETKIVLKSAYQGSTESDASYQIFSRANVIWVSRPGYPESFEPLKFINGPNNEMAGDVTAGVGYGSSMLFYSLSSCFKIAWDSDPLVDPVIIPLSNKYGALNQRVVVEVEGRVYAMDRLGWTVWEGVFPRLISRPVDTIRDSIDYTKSDNFHCVFFPSLRAIRWFVCYSGETYPKHYVQLDVDTGAWSTGEFYQGISESRLVPTSSGPKVFLGDENGHTWIADVGTCDGCDEDDSHLTVAAGATTTAIPTDETLPTTGVGLAGCYVAWIRGDGTRERRLIQSNTSSALTVSSAFSQAPADGDALWVGPIPSKLKSRAFGARGSRRHKARPRYLTVEFTPEEDTRYLQIRAYDDLSNTAKAWATGTRNDLKGATWPGNNADYPTTDFLADLSGDEGQVSIPLGGEFRRYIEFEVECEEPGADVEIVSFEVDGLEREDLHS